MNYTFGDILQYGLLYLTDQRGAAAMILSLIGICAAGYLLGGVNFGIIVSKALYKDDIRNHGSGNAGLTNMLRTYGKGAAALTLAGDVLKTVLACYIGALALGQTGAFLAGFSSLIGHMWPVWFKFKGGKGVLSLAAVTLCCCPPLFVVLFTVFFIIVASTKYISLGSVICALLYPILLSRFIGTQNFIIIPSAIIAFIIVFRHRSNIKRLYNKNENKIKLSEKGVPTWVLIVIGAVLVAASAFSVYAAFAKNPYVIKYKDSGITTAQFTVLYVDEKNKDPDASEKTLIGAADVRGDRIAVLGKIAAEKGRSISAAGSESAKRYFENNLTSLPGYLEGDTAETYCHRIYGVNVSPAVVTELIRRETFVNEYVSEIGEEEAAKQLKEAIDEGYKSGEYKKDSKTIDRLVDTH